MRGSMAAALAASIGLVVAISRMSPVSNYSIFELARYPTRCGDMHNPHSFPIDAGMFIPTLV